VEPTAYGSNQLSLAVGLGNALSCRIRTAPSTPYTITAAFHINARSGVNFAIAGLLWRESSTGRIVSHQTRGNNGFIATAKYNSSVSFNADYASANVGNILGTRTSWLRMTDDGVNRITSYSWDGFNFIQLHTVTRTDFLTADQVGWTIQTSGGLDMFANLFSWLQS
jgi:hypothetical protein